MRIAVDARSVFQDASVRGIGKSLIGLYSALAVARPRWQFDLYYQDSAGRPNPFAGVPQITPRRVSGPGDRFNGWLDFWLPFTAWRSGAAVLHCHGNTAPRYSRVPLVTTIHDLTLLTYPTASPDLPKWVRNVRRAARNSRRILTPSEDARRDIADRMNVSADKIEVIRWGLTDSIRRTEDADLSRAVRERYELSGPYLLHFGMTLPRKNTGQVIDAWARLTAAERGTATLLIVGVESAAGVETFRARAATAGVSDSCAIRGYVPEEDVAPLLSAAAGLVYVPLAEGFGMPVLDAFTCETPVLASDCSSVPEVAGDAAVLVNPHDSVAIAAGMAKLLTDPSLADRLRAAGRDRVGEFTWEACAEQVARVFEQVARR